MSYIRSVGDDLLAIRADQRREEAEFKKKGCCSYCYSLGQRSFCQHIGKAASKVDQATKTFLAPDKL
jgi:hypothetical protein